MAWRDEMAAIFEPAERMAREIAADLAECRRGMEDVRLKDTALQHAYAAKLGTMLEELDG